MLAGVGAQGQIRNLDLGIPRSIKLEPHTTGHKQEPKAKDISLPFSPSCPAESDTDSA